MKIKYLPKFKLKLMQEEIINLKVEVTINKEVNGLL